MRGKSEVGRGTPDGAARGAGRDATRGPSPTGGTRGRGDALGKNRHRPVLPGRREAPIRECGGGAVDARRPPVGRGRRRFGRDVLPSAGSSASLVAGRWAACHVDLRDGGFLLRRLHAIRLARVDAADASARDAVPPDPAEPQGHPIDRHRRRAQKPLTRRRSFRKFGRA